MSNAAVTLDPKIRPEHYSPLDPAVRANPYPYYAALRREAPVHPLRPGLPIHAVSRWEDVNEVLHSPERFSSTALQAIAQGGGVGLGPNSGALAGHRLIASPMMIAVDPPDHTRLRGLVNRGFTPRRIAALAPRLREIAERWLAPCAARGQLELVSEYAVPFPVTVIAELLGVEADRYEQFKRWSDAFVLGLSGTVSAPPRESVRASADEMAEYIDRVCHERRRAPRDDLISVLVQAEGGEALTTGQVMSFVTLLLIAGNETTTNLIGNMTKALLAHPDALARVAADRALIPDAVEEALRYDSPVQGLPRRVVADTELAHTKLSAGSVLLVLFASANRDERRFPEPDRFDLDRRERDHVAFGHGIHFCLGAALARLEARIAFETLFSRCKNLRLAEPEIPMLDSMTLRGPRRLALAFDPA